MPRRETSTGGRDATNGIIPGKFSLSVGCPNIVAPLNFCWIKLTDIARLESGHTPSKSNPTYWNGDIPWVGIRDATSNHGKTIYSTAQYITEEGVKNSSARLLPAGTICLSRTASVGYVVKIGVPMATSQDFVNWVCGPRLAPSYLHYLLMAEQDSIRRFAHGTTHQTMYYPEAKALHVCIPGRSEQDAIVEVLGALDDKIASNTELSNTALMLARAVFSGALSDGDGQQVMLGRLAQHLPGKYLPKEAYARGGRYSVYGSNSVMGSHHEALHKGAFAVLARIGSYCGNLRWSQRPAWVNNNASALVARQSTDPWIVRHVLDRVDMAPHRVGSSQPFIRIDSLLSVDVEVPSDRRCGLIAPILKDLAERETVATEESRTLAVTRDVLLLQLISGRIRVKDAQKTVEEVL